MPFIRLRSPIVELSGLKTGVTFFWKLEHGKSWIWAWQQYCCALVQYLASSTILVKFATLGSKERDLRVQLTELYKIIRDILKWCTLFYITYQESLRCRWWKRLPLAALSTSPRYMLLFCVIRHLMLLSGITVHERASSRKRTSQLSLLLLPLYITPTESSDELLIPT